MAGKGITLDVEGLRELEKALVAIADVGAPRVLAKALRKPMEPVRDAARSLCPYDVTAPGPHLRDQIDLTATKRATAKRAASAETLSEVGLRIKKPPKGMKGKNPRRYWHLVEFGTSRNGARSFIRAAFDSNVQPMLDSFKATMRAEIERVRTRVARRRK